MVLHIFFCKLKVNRFFGTVLKKKNLPLNSQNGVQSRAHDTSGYLWSNPIRVNDFSLRLSLIGIFLYGLPGTIVSGPGQLVFAPGNP